MVEEHEKQVVFRAREIDRGSLGIEEGAAAQVEAPAAKADRLGIARRQRNGHRRRASEHGPDAREQFGAVERLGNVVVRAEFETEDAVRFLAAR